MDYLEQMLEDLESGSQLIIRCQRSESAGIRFQAFVIDTKGKEYIEADRATLDLAMGALDKLADDWLSSDHEAEAEARTDYADPMN